MLRNELLKCKLDHRALPVISSTVTSTSFSFSFELRLGSDRGTKINLALVTNSCLIIPYDPFSTLIIFKLVESLHSKGSTFFLSAQGKKGGGSSPPPHFPIRQRDEREEIFK